MIYKENITQSAMKNLYSFNQLDENQKPHDDGHREKNQYNYPATSRSILKTASGQYILSLFMHTESFSLIEPNGIVIWDSINQLKTEERQQIYAAYGEGVLEWIQECILKINDGLAVEADKLFWYTATKASSSQFVMSPNEMPYIDVEIFSDGTLTMTPFSIFGTPEELKKYIAAYGRLYGPELMDHIKEQYEAVTGKSFYITKKN